MFTTNSGTSYSVMVLLLFFCVGLVAMMFLGSWYFQYSLVELEAQQQETAQIVQHLKEKVSKQSVQLSKLSSLLDYAIRQLKVLNANDAM